MLLTARVKVVLVQVFKSHGNNVDFGQHTLDHVLKALGDWRVGSRVLEVQAEFAKNSSAWTGVAIIIIETM
jgi:hypothetical protein